MVYAQELKIVKAISSPRPTQKSRTTSRTEDFASHRCAIDAAASGLFSDFINARNQC